MSTKLSALVIIALAAQLEFQVARAADVDAPVQRAFERAVAGEVLIQTARGCGWVESDQVFIAARNASFKSALVGLDVRMRMEVSLRLFDSKKDWFKFAEIQAKKMVLKGACDQAATRSAWDQLRALSVPAADEQPPTEPPTSKPQAPAPAEPASGGTAASPR